MNTSAPFVSRDEFYLNPDIVFLNNGSFGATPKAVMAEYQSWQIELERQPVEFLDRRAPGLLKKSREVLAEIVGTKADNLVFMSNATQGINTVARSLDLKTGDEVLATDLEYGAMDRTWRFLAQQKGFTYIRRETKIPLTTHEDFVEYFWKGVNSRTRVIFLSHITSQSAVALPVAEICRRARERNIKTVIDGAHAPGQIDLDLDLLGADFYTGNLHKWHLTPKGTAFLFVRPECQPVDPLVVSWGWESEAPGASRFIDYHEFQGTRDISGFLCLDAAVKFMEKHDWKNIRSRCRELVREARKELIRMTGQAPLHGDDSRWETQMATVFLPDDTDVFVLKKNLYDSCQIEIPVWKMGGKPILRIAIQAFNSREDVEKLFRALNQLHHGIRSPL